MAETVERLSDLLSNPRMKWNAEMYASRYEHYFAPLRDEPLKLLEIGIGGYEDTLSGGHSLRAWKRYFPNATIYGIDIADKKALEEERIKTFQGSQDDGAFLEQVVAETGQLDIIIDDGSHQNAHMIKTFKLLFPTLSENGIYAVEDTHFSYVPSPKDGNIPEHWARYGGSLDLNEPSTVMNFFKRLTDCLSHQEFLRPGYRPNYFDLHVVAIHFYRNQVFVLKGDNSAQGNFCENNTLRPEWLESMGVGSVDELNLKYPVIDDPTVL